ncbi:MAG: hypothetical protein ABI036_05445 [Fibrobacteria bacterium]
MLDTMTLLMIAIALLCLTGCQPETTATKAEGTLYQCTGEAGYAPGAVDRHSRIRYR